MSVKGNARAYRGARRLRPHSWLFRQALTATLAFLVPVFGVLYFLTVPDGAWIVVLATQAATAVVLAVAAVLFFRSGIWVDERGITERGFFGTLIVAPIDSIGSIVMVRTYHGGGADTLPQLFVCGHDGSQLIRLRGQFWSAETMGIVRDALDVPVTDLPESVSSRQLLETHPGLLYWFERRPVLAAALFCTAVVCGGVLLYLGLAFFGITSSGLH
jgi:hypothetical protein